MNEMKYRKLRCAKELAAVPIEDVAKIAAMLAHDPGSETPKKGSNDGNTAQSETTTRERVDEENPLVSATAKAFELLEIAYYGNFGLTNQGSYEAGLADFVESKKIDEEFREAVAKIPKWEYDEHGKKRPVRFDEGLADLIPKPGVKASQAANARLKRFKSFLVDWLRIDPTDDERDLAEKADAAIEELKRDGIQPEQLSKWQVVFPEWWKRKLSETRSTVGQKGQAKTKKKGKQGRVKSQGDKRLGPRLTEFRRNFAFGDPS